MRDALLELKSIARFADPQTREHINRWIFDHIKQSSIQITEHEPFNEEHSKYNIEDARHQLGKLIGANANMYPTWEVQRNGDRVTVLTALYFKNEYGV